MNPYLIIGWAICAAVLAVLLCLTSAFAVGFVRGLRRPKTQTNWGVTKAYTTVYPYLIRTPPTSSTPGVSLTITTATRTWS